MGGGLMQLVAYGAQDIYLTGNPQITFFKVVYRRHTNFSMESIQQTFSGQADFGRRVTCTISRNGDLIHRMYLVVKLPAWDADASESGYEGLQEGWCDYFGHALIKDVELEIGGQRIDKQYGEWLHIWEELTKGISPGFQSMIGASITAPPAVPTSGTVAGGDADYTGATSKVPASTVYIPLKFWFCNNPGLALPLIALQYHEVKINLQLNDKKNMVTYLQKENANVPSISDASLYVDYFYLDTDERRKFAQASHEYLIEQVQFTGDENAQHGANKVVLDLNHPCKELIWISRNSVAEANNAWFNFSGIVSNQNPIIDATMQLNGHDRFSEREGSYFGYVQPYQHHSNIPSPGINVYSFALLPEEHQPSGSCNFSRIDNAVLSFHLDNPLLRVGQPDQYRPTAVFKLYARNYNILRIMSGMGGLAFSN